VTVCSVVYLGAYSECTWERPESFVESVSQAGWVCGIESIWEHTIKPARTFTKMNINHWKPPRVSEMMGSVNLDQSISGELQTLEGQSGWHSE